MGIRLRPCMISSTISPIEYTLPMTCLTSSTPPPTAMHDIEWTIPTPLPSPPPSFLSRVARTPKMASFFFRNLDGPLVFLLTLYAILCTYISTYCTAIFDVMQMLSVLMRTQATDRPSPNPTQPNRCWSLCAENGLRWKCSGSAARRHLAPVPPPGGLGAWPHSIPAGRRTVRPLFSPPLMRSERTGWLSSSREAVFLSRR